MATTTQERPGKAVRRYRLLQGIHEHTHPTETYLCLKDNVVKAKTVTYTPPRPGMGDPDTIIESDFDLETLNGPDPRMAKKFERVHEDPTPQKARTVLVDFSLLEKKSNKELVEFCEDNEIDITGKVEKKDVLLAIRQAMGG